MSANSLFYEWLNSYDIKDAIERPDRASKKWDDIVKFAAPLLRKRIGNQTESGNVTLSYEQLLTLADGLIKEDESLKLATTFGDRSLPLSALFIDTLADNRPEQVKKWTNELVAALAGNGADAEKAIEVSAILWQKYLDDFVDRIDLSEYASRESELTDEERERFNELKEKYSVKDGNFENEFSVQNSFEKSTASRFTIRLAVLHLMAKASIEMLRCSQAAPNSEFYTDLTDRERLNLLFPFYNFKKKSGSLVLPMHAPSEWTVLSNKARKWLASHLTIVDQKVTQENCLDPEAWIKSGEKSLLKSVFFEDREFYPQWLR